MPHANPPRFHLTLPRCRPHRDHEDTAGVLPHSLILRQYAAAWRRLIHQQANAREPLQQVWVIGMAADLTYPLGAECENKHRGSSISCPRPRPQQSPTRRRASGRPRHDGARTNVYSAAKEPKRLCDDGIRKSDALSNSTPSKGRTQADSTAHFEAVLWQPELDLAGLWAPCPAVTQFAACYFRWICPVRPMVPWACLLDCLQLHQFRIWELTVHHGHCPRGHPCTTLISPAPHHVVQQIDWISA